MNNNINNADDVYFVPTAETPQTLPLPGKTMLENHAGGFVFELDTWKRLDRFLVLGSEGGTYYVSETELTLGNVKNIMELIQREGPRVVNHVVEFLKVGRAPKPDPAIFVLAVAAAKGDLATRKAVFAAVPTALTTGTHLFTFLKYAKAHRGWGRGFKKAVQNWFKQREPEVLAFHLSKYKQRNGWSMRDVLRLAKPTPDNASQGMLFGWATNPKKAQWIHNPVAPGEKSLDFIWAAQQATQLQVQGKSQVHEEAAQKLSQLITSYRLPREVLLSESLTRPETWEALLQVMPMTAMIRNLGTMSKVGLLKPLSNAEKLVVGRLTDIGKLKKARVHPIQVLSALRTYSSGAGVLSDSEWCVSAKVVEALDAAFELSCGTIEPAGTRHLLGLDVSGSMSLGEIAGVTGLTPAAASAALAVVAARTEPWAGIMGFCDTFQELGISAADRIDAATQKVANLSFGSTDVAVPMTWAMENKIEVDTFVILTDNETWYGNVHPSTALENYRQKMGIDAKLIVVGMTATEFTVADPNDRGMLDVVGFDAATPALMASFARGEV